MYLYTSAIPALLLSTLLARVSGVPHSILSGNAPDADWPLVPDEIYDVNNAIVSVRNLLEKRDLAIDNSCQGANANAVNRGIAEAQNMVCQTKNQIQTLIINKKCLG